jgi:hypothetical protein
LCGFVTPAIAQKEFNSVPISTGPPISNSESTAVKKLVYELQPAIYMLDGGLKYFGSEPVVLFCDVPTLNNQKEMVANATSVQLVQIKVRNLKELNKIDLSVLAHYPNVRFIQILSEIEVSSEAIKKALKHELPSWRIFYTISKLS